MQRAGGRSSRRGGGRGGTLDGETSHDPRSPVYLASVGAGMTRLAGEIADGLIVRPLHSRRYVADVVLPSVADGGAGRERDAVTIAASVIVASGETEIAEARRTIGFYASTRPTDQCWSTTAGEPSATRWPPMRDAADGTRWRHSGDEMLDAFAVIATDGHVRGALERHGAGLFDRVAPYQPFGTGSWGRLIA